MDMMKELSIKKEIYREAEASRRYGCFLPSFHQKRVVLVSSPTAKIPHQQDFRAACQNHRRRGGKLAGERAHRRGRNQKVVFFSPLLHPSAPRRF